VTFGPGLPHSLANGTSGRSSRANVTLGRLDRHSVILIIDGGRRGCHMITLDMIM
jgi:hypothetical protein